MRQRLLLIASIIVCLECGCSNMSGKLKIYGDDDIDGLALVIQNGSFYSILAPPLYPNSKLMYVDSYTDIPVMIQRSKADCGFISAIVWEDMKDTYPDLIGIPCQIPDTPLGFAFNKERKDLRDKFNIFLHSFMNSDEFEEMVENWKRSADSAEMTNTDDCTGGILRCAVSPDMYPYEFVRNGEIVGMEVEIVKRFAKEMNLKCELINMNFSALVSHLCSGKSDIAFSMMSITKERAESVDFSDKWIVEPTLTIIKKSNYFGSLQAENGNDNKGTNDSLIDKLKKSYYKNFVSEDRYKLILKGLWMTLLISLVSALLGTLLGILICFGQKVNNKVSNAFCNFYVSFMRCMPQLVFLMIMYYVVFGHSSVQAYWVAILAFALCFGAYTSVIFKSTLESIDKGQNEAGYALGFSRIKTFAIIILPQLVRRALPIYKNEFVGLIKATSIVGYISVFDLTRAGDIIRSRTFEAFAPLLIITIFYFLIIWILSLVIKYAEIKSQPKRRKYSKQ